MKFEEKKAKQVKEQMANGYTYELKLRDLMSNSLRKAGAVASSFNQKMLTLAKNVRQSTNGTGSSINQLQTKLVALARRRDNAFSTKEISAYNRQIRQTESSLHRLKNLPPLSLIERFRQAKSNLLGMIGLTGGLATALAIFGAGTGILKLGGELEQTRISFQTMLGSAEKGNKMIADLQKMGAATPFGEKELNDNAKLLLNFGVAGQKVLPTLRMLGDVSGGNVERLNGLTLAFSQVSSAGKMQGQDLMQMINAGFNPLQEISKLTGESMSSLRDKMSQGAISAKMVELAFQAATAKGGMFNNMMEKQSQTMAGRWSTFVDTFMAKMAQLGEALAPFIGFLINIATILLNALFAIPKALARIWSWMGKNKIVVGGLAIAAAALSANFLIAKGALLAATIATKAQVLWTGILTVATHGLSTAIKSIPVIGWIIAIIGLVIAAIAWLVDNWEWVVGKFKGGWVIMTMSAKLAWNSMVLSFQMIGYDLKLLWLKFKNFGQWIGALFKNVGTAIKLALNFDFAGAKRALSQPIITSASKEIAATEKAKNETIKNSMIETMKITKEGIKAFAAYNKAAPKNQQKKLHDKANKMNKSRDQIGDEMAFELKNGTSGLKKKKNADKAESIVTGGTKSITLNIQIDKVIETINQQISDGKKSADDLVDEILDQLTRRLHGTFRTISD